jgi:hypothetical protein
MRLLVTGKTRSGKSTALHRILSHALHQKWAGVLLLDGKGSELSAYNSVPGVTYLGPDQVDQWAGSLQTLADKLPARYADLTARGLRQAEPADPRYLVVADEVQRGTRDRDYGREIKSALQLIAEQSAALGDVLILAAQRPEHSIPPNVRFNCNVHLRMLGQGYFHLQADGFPTRSGRVAYLTPDQSLEAINRSLPLPLGKPVLSEVEGGRGEGDFAQPIFSVESLPDVLGSKAVQPGRMVATLYLGQPGSGKTHALHAHPNGHLRHIYVDAGQPHRQVLLDVIERAGASAPARASIPDLAEIASLAVAAEPTLLLVDNLDQASARMPSTITRLMAAAAESALAANAPRTPGDQRKLEPLIPHCRVARIYPLGREQARALATANLPPDLADREAVVQRVVDVGGGHPATIVALSRRVRRGSLAELREFSANPRRKIALGWMIVVPALALLIVSRWQLGPDSYWLSLALLAASILLRPLFYRSIRNVGRGA